MAAPIEEPKEATKPIQFHVLPAADLGTGPSPTGTPITKVNEDIEIESAEDGTTQVQPATASLEASLEESSLTVSSPYLVPAEAGPAEEVAVEAPAPVVEDGLEEPIVEPFAPVNATPIEKWEDVTEPIHDVTPIVSVEQSGLTPVDEQAPPPVVVDTIEGEEVKEPQHHEEVDRIVPVQEEVVIEPSKEIIVEEVAPVVETRVPTLAVVANIEEEDIKESEDRVEVIHAQEVELKQVEETSAETAAPINDQVSPPDDVAAPGEEGIGELAHSVDGEAIAQAPVVAEPAEESVVAPAFESHVHSAAVAVVKEEIREPESQLEADAIPAPELVDPLEEMVIEEPAPAVESHTAEDATSVPGAPVATQEEVELPSGVQLEATKSEEETISGEPSVVEEVTVPITQLSARRKSLLQNCRR